MTNLICAHCETSFVRGAGEHAKALRKGKTKHYCSRQCVGASRATGDTMLSLICGTCRRPFERAVADHNRNLRLKGLQKTFCSPECSIIGRTLNQAPGPVIQTDFNRPRRAFNSGATLAARIAHYSSGPKGDHGCIEWTGSVSGTNGRPILKIGTTHQIVARVVWIQHKGPIPKGLIVRHVVCRNKLCINVNHLDTGTHLDNAADAQRDGTTARGELQGNAVLVEWQVQDILTSSDSLRVVARRHGISKSQAGRIRRGEDWRHIVRSVPS